MYKLIGKVLVNRLKGIFSSYISEEQFGFLFSRHILDAIVLAQECLHSIKTMKIPIVMMKLDLVKAYNNVN